MLRSLEGQIPADLDQATGIMNVRTDQSGGEKKREGENREPTE